ncbi:MAG: hypothetical protein HY013_08065 [Candidatus Solibacter usitatus]|nr:hypothetical protein [Candidatus Solibacter usitatus]
MLAYAAGPEPGKTGAPGESTCADAGCHTGTVNSGQGSVKIDAGGSSYQPGVKQRIKVTVSDPVQRRWGFQLTARVGATRTQAGSFTPVDGNTQVLCSNANFREQPCSGAALLQFIEHTMMGTRPGTVTGATFDFDWNPPATNVGPVMLYAAGNASNNNAQNTGDSIYTTNVMLTPDAGGTKPVISQGGVANGAGFQANIAAATWISVFGSNLSTSTRTLMASEVVGGKLPTTLDGVSLTVNGKSAFPYSISPGLLTAQSPSDSMVGPVNVVVTLNGVASDPVPVPLQTFSPAFFLWPGGVAVATDPNFNSRVKPGAFPGATTVAAKPDEVIILWGTGFGPSNPDVPAGQLVPGDRAYNIANPVTVTVGGMTAEVFGAALASSNASVVQVAIRVPPNAPDGDLPVVATVGSVSSPATTLLTVKR